MDEDVGGNSVLSTKCALLPGDLHGIQQPFSRLPGYPRCCTRSSPRNVSEMHHSKVSATEGGRRPPPWVAPTGWECRFPRWRWEGASGETGKAQEFDLRGQEAVMETGCGGCRGGAAWAGFSTQSLLGQEARGRQRGWRAQSACP